jgi:hypothetical protein
MASEIRSWTRQGEAFWRAHHEAWKRSDLNQRQYCEAEGIPPKAFGNWRAKFKAEPQPAERKLLYRRRGLSHPLSPPLSHPLSHPLSQLSVLRQDPFSGHLMPYDEQRDLRIGLEGLSEVIEQAKTTSYPSAAGRDEHCGDACKTDVAALNRILGFIKRFFPGINPLQDEEKRHQQPDDRRKGHQCLAYDRGRLPYLVRSAPRAAQSG